MRGLGPCEGREADMSDDLQRGPQDLDADEGIELSDDELDGVAGGYIYHDEGDAAAHRREAYYVVDDAGHVVRFDSLAKAEHWAGNLRTTTKLITAEEFEQLRKKHV